MTGPTQLLIGGKFQDAQSGKTFPSINPATEEILAQVAEADAPDIDAAVKAARTAFNHKSWTQMSARDRSKLLWKVGDLIMKYADELALMGQDNGKPSSGPDAWISLQQRKLYYSAGVRNKVRPIPLQEFLQLHAGNLMGMRHHTPWLSLLMVAWKLALRSPAEHGC
jgi:acyl-CoA reductase-like NAD-dependent aldehyde dehydrogenase